MVHIRTTQDIILSLIDFLRTAQPLLDTKPGTASRDVFIDGPSSQMAKLYEELRGISNLQSLRLTIGSDLDRVARNFGAVRETGSKSTGPALLTFADLTTDIAINIGDTITAKNGTSFSVLNSLVISPVEANNYRAFASKYQADLDFLGITDTYAAEVLVEADTTGIQGNISKYSLVSTTILNVNNVTNVFAFGGGLDVEDDDTFRNRVLAIFGGANTGTELGYKNTALSDNSVIDALVVVPGDSLMTRDGTQVSVASDGTRTITSEGTGGKVDIIVFGTRIQEVTDSYIYVDLSNTDDPTHADNDHVLGQIAADEGKTVSRKRIDNLSDEVLPSQPVFTISEVTGSLSGSNFVEKDVDEFGVITGNYELQYDTGAYAGSPWGFDSLAWISDRVSDFSEDLSKGTFNGQDPLSYTDLIVVDEVEQNVPVTNENSAVSISDRSSIQLSHYPVTNVTRVFNVTTGERYVVSSQNPDGTGSINETGRITVTGQSLPSISDVLQTDYTWILSHDPYFDFDNRELGNNIRTVRDSVDWGLSNVVRREQATLIAAGSFLTATVTHAISSVVSVNVFTEDIGNLTLSSGRLAFITSESVSNVVSIIRDSDGAELWDTSDNDGTFSGNTIFLPTDTVGVFGNAVTVVYNAIDVYNATTQGTFSTNVISVVPSTSATAGTIVECNYIANVSIILPSTTLTDLPAIRSGNRFDTNTRNNQGNQPTSHIFNSFGIVTSNLRQGPTPLALNISGAVSSGVITLTGITIDSIFDVVFTVSTAGLKHNLSSVIKDYLGLASSASVPANVRIARVTKVEKVTTNATLVVLSTDVTYDVKGYKIFDNTFVKDESVIDSTLSLTEFELPATPDNQANSPVVGDRIRIRFHISTTGDSENVSFSRAGQLSTNKRFLLVDTIAISSGFTSTASASASLTVTNMNQPAIRVRYKSIYDYLAPKPNERISIRYNYDKLVTDVTLAVEDSRPVNADVLVKAAVPVLVDVTMNIVVTESFENSPEIVRQNVQDAITSELNATKLGTITDQSDLINAAYTVSGLDRARILYFNKANESGSVLSIEAQKNEYIVANNVTVNTETR
jgi:hypothetical protein